MVRKLWIIACLFLLCHVVFAKLPPPKKISRVIYITFDGTRWQDIFLDKTYFPKLWGIYAPHLNFYGAPQSKTIMEVASTPISLPSYQSQMAGLVQLCTNNDCGRIKVETVVEKIMRKLVLNKTDVATFSSWAGINLAVEHIENAIYTNTGNEVAYDPITQQVDEVMASINQQQANDHPLSNERYDKYTFAQALHYLKKYHPRFLWISLNDADANAHHGDLSAYHQTLLFYDDLLDVLFTTLKEIKLDEETIVIVITDHGRGNGDNWKHHGPAYPESKQTWGLVYHGKLIPDSKIAGIYHYSTLSIRPTFEKVYL